VALFEYSRSPVLYVCALGFTGRLNSHRLLYVAWTECVHRTYCVIPIVMELFYLLTLYTPIRKFPTVFRSPSSTFGGPYQQISVIYSADCTFVSTDDVE